MTEPIEPRRVTSQEYNQLASQGVGGQAWQLAGVNVTWPTEYWIIEEIDGEPRVVPVLMLRLFTVIGTVDTRGETPQFAYAWAYEADFPPDYLGPTGVEGVEPFHTIISALDIDEAVAMIRATVESPPV